MFGTVGHHHQRRLPQLAVLPELLQARHDRAALLFLERARAVPSTAAAISAASVGVDGAPAQLLLHALVLVPPVQQPGLFLELSRGRPLGGVHLI